MKYNVDYFINKFSAIPEEKWCTRVFERDGQFCAQGHCGMNLHNRYYVWGASNVELVPEELKEGWYLLNLFPRDNAAENIAGINNGDNPRYNQPTPKQRVLAALYDLKKYNSPKHTDITAWKYIDVYNKLTEAYIKGEVNPHSACGCMIGNLFDKRWDWTECRDARFYDSDKGHVFSYEEAKYLGDVQDWRDAISFIETQSEGTYTPQEIADIEAIFMYTYIHNGGGETAFIEDTRFGGEPTQQDEEALWLAFVAGLEKIKEIHISKGEDVDQIVTLPKRYELV